MRLERQCARCCDSLSLLCHALVDSPARTRALWLLTRVADFLLKVHSGEWKTYHPLRQRVFFRQLAADIAGALHGDLAGSVPDPLRTECETVIREFLTELQAARHYPGKHEDFPETKGYPAGGAVSSDQFMSQRM
ncbi:MAG: hypothetical protein KJ072_04080 [Verrucomicrobia bacterium]|nr:hypothetical protein [Verrucomicrobiota bacterium]